MDAFGKGFAGGCALGYGVVFLECAPYSIIIVVGIGVVVVRGLFFVQGSHSNGHC